MAEAQPYIGNPTDVCLVVNCNK